MLAIGRVLSPLTPWWDSLVGAVVGFGILYIIAVLSNGGMGGGDIKLFFLIGLVLGTIDTLLTLFSCSDWYDCRDYRVIEEQTREKNTHSIWAIYCIGRSHCLFLWRSINQLVFRLLVIVQSSRMWREASETDYWYYSLCGG